MVFDDLLQARINDYNAMKYVYKSCRYNKDGTDKIKCFYESRKKKFNNLEIDDILYLYDKNLWEAILKWTDKKYIKKNKSIERNEFHKLFVMYVWVSISQDYLDEIIYKIFGNKNMSEERLIFLKSLRHAIPISELSDDVLIVDGEELLEKYFYYLKRFHRIVKCFPPKKERWEIVLKLIMKNFKIGQIAKITGVTSNTIRVDVMKLIWLFDNINLIT